MFRALTVVQQIMTELEGAVSEEAKIFAITKTVINLIKKNGKQSL
jgi:phage terminase large subunit-like protein